MTVSSNITTDKTSDNGVNVDALLGAREALTQAPEAAQFNWRADCTWLNGAHAKTTVNKFFGLGEEQSHRQAMTVDTDHPQLFDATDNGMSPPEIMLVGLLGCLTAGIASVAQNRNIQLHSVTSTIKADMDLQGILGIDSEVRNGFSNMHVHFNIDADGSDADIAAVVAQSQKRSAVFDIITNPTNVHVSVN